MTSQVGSLTNPSRYTGREADAGFQRYHYRARVYDPSARRFLQKDPAGMADGTNRYAYVGNNLVNRVDPIGLGIYFNGGGGSISAYTSWSIWYYAQDCFKGRFCDCLGKCLVSSSLTLCAAIFYGDCSARCKEWAEWACGLDQDKILCLVGNPWPGRPRSSGSELPPWEVPAWMFKAPV